MNDLMALEMKNYLQLLRNNSINQEFNLLGVGCDICEIKRIESLHQRWGDKIVSRILSPDEFNLWIVKNKNFNFVAKRWAGKEAVVKSLGLGFQKGLRWREVSILNDVNGKPFVEFSGQTQKLLSSNEQFIRCFISLADENQHALAFCIAYTRRV